MDAHRQHLSRHQTTIIRGLEYAMPIHGKRILVLIPHPDDEVVGCAAAIARARANGARVYALYLGHGCLAKDTLWPWQRKNHARMVETRMTEAAAVAEFLGLTVVGTNTQRAAREIWTQLDAVRAEVQAAIQACAPDRVWVPAYEGGNPDHDGLNAIGTTFDDVPVFEYAEYNLNGGHTNSNTFISPRATDAVLNLNESERQMKRAALDMYRSEKGNLGAIDTAQEALRLLVPYDYAQRPHEGKLWYERFQWVPFRHPRVDYTKAEDVSRAITEFLRSY